MPVRAIKKIQTGLKGSDPGELALKVPKTIIQAIRLRSDDIFVCELKKHFDSKQKLIREIDETVEFHCQHDYFGWDLYSSTYYLDAPHIIILTGLCVTKKYGFLAKECLEIIFKEVKREKQSIAIFPERMVEDLDFKPGEK